MSTTPDRIKVGLDLPTSDRTGLGWSELRDIAMLAEDVGFDSIWLDDHLLYHMRGAAEPNGVPPLRERVDEACAEVGRDPATLERTVSVLTAEPDADPWWNTLPTGHD